MNFKEAVERNFNEWSTLGYCKEAEELNKKLGVAYFDTAAPHFFTGDLNANIALIQLNPKRDEVGWNKQSNFANFEEYWNSFAHFGKKHYGINATRTHKSKFDHKQIRFLKPFNILPFVEDDTYHNLEISIDQKLQLELVPFGSPNFDYTKIGQDNLMFYIHRLIDVLSSTDRKYIIFCGRVFHNLLKKYITEEKTHSFHLEKVDGTSSKRKYSLINIKIKHNNKEITACIAPQFSQQGCPIDRYGEKVSSLYGIF